MERLSDFGGYLQTDGYRAYETYLRAHPGVEGVSCLAHIRRYFFEAQDHHRSLADTALAAIGYLYHVDAHCRRRGRSLVERLALRRRKSYRVYLALLDWVKYEQKNNLSQRACGGGAPQGKPIGKALHYAKHQLPKLAACFEDGRIDLDNNLIENSIRPLALGRCDRLGRGTQMRAIFAGSHQGAQMAAMMYSFFASCQKLEGSPREWLADVLDRIANQPFNRLRDLLLDQWVK